MAVRASYRPEPQLGFLGRAARAFAYVLLVVTCTVIAALGGYEVGVRSNPSQKAADARREQAVRTAVRDAVAAQRAKDRALRRSALAQAMQWQRDKFDEELSARISRVRLEDSANAARAYRRGQSAGKQALIDKVKAKAAAKPADAPAGQPPAR